MQLPIFIGASASASGIAGGFGAPASDEMLSQDPALSALGGSATQDDPLEFASLLTGLFVQATLAPSKEDETSSVTTEGTPLEDAETEDESAGSYNDLLDWSELSPQLVPLLTEPLPSTVGAHLTQETCCHPGQATDLNFADSTQALDEQFSLIQSNTASHASTDVSAGLSTLDVDQGFAELPSMNVGAEAASLQPDSMAKPVDGTEVVLGSEMASVDPMSSWEGLPEPVPLSSSESLPTVAVPAATAPAAMSGESAVPASTQVRQAKDATPHPNMDASIISHEELVSPSPESESSEEPLSVGDVQEAKLSSALTVASDLNVDSMEGENLAENPGRSDQQTPGERADAGLSNARFDLASDGRVESRSNPPAPTKAIDDVEVVWQIVDAMKVAHDDQQMAHPRIEVELDPPELGRVSIELSDTDRGLSARIVVQRESTALLVEQQMATIRQSLDQAGLSVRDFQVSHQESSLGRNAFSSGSHQEMTRDRESGRWRGSRTPTPEPLAGAGPAVTRWRAANRVDLRL